MEHSSYCLACTACMTRGLYVLLALTFLKNKLLSKENSGSAAPIFTKFLQYGGHLIVDCRFDPLFPVAQGWLKGRFHDNQF